jgi:hypothetical protein
LGDFFANSSGHTAACTWLLLFQLDACFPLSIHRSICTGSSTGSTISTAPIRLKLEPRQVVPSAFHVNMWWLVLSMLND